MLEASVANILDPCNIISIRGYIRFYDDKGFFKSTVIRSGGKRFAHPSIGCRNN